jgi:hypothetical protein
MALLVAWLCRQVFDMEHINFLEPRKFSFQKLEFNYFLIVAVAGALLFSFIIYGVVQKNRVDAKNAELVAVIAEVEKLTSASQQLIPKDISQQSPFKVVLQTRVQWAELVNAIVLRGQKTLRVLGLKGDRGVLKISGEGVNLESVMQFKSRLESVPEIRKVTLASSAEEGSSDKRRVVFELECRL